MNGTIYVDFDDVLSETARMLVEVVATRFGRRTPFENIYSFDLALSFGLEPHEQDILSKLFHDADVLGSIPAVSGAAAAMQAWADAGCAVHVVTGRPPETHDASRHWLKMHNMPYTDITFVDKYGRGHTTIPDTNQMTLSEVEACNFALVVDDSPDMVQLLAKRTDMPIAIFDRPWNTQIGTAETQSNVWRFHDWKSLLEQFPNPGI